MSTEQQLLEALRATAAYAPSPDLWRRVVHSIEEDRRHRRRVLTTATAIITLGILLSVIVWVSYESGTVGSRVDWRVLEATEALALTSLVAALGPAIRRFGRSFAADLFLNQRPTGNRLLSLLDIAYYLVFAGYVLMTTRLEAPTAFATFDASGQIKETAIRLGGLLLAMGLLHALALVSLPLIALVFNSTRAGQRLPRWVVIVLIVAAIGAVTSLPGFFALGLGE